MEDSCCAMLSSFHFVSSSLWPSAYIHQKINKSQTAIIKEILLDLIKALSDIERAFQQRFIDIHELGDDVTHSLRSHYDDDHKKHCLNSIKGERDGTN